MHSTPTQAEPDPILDNYVLLVVVMSLFVGGTLVVLSGVLLLCKRCWEVHQRFNRCLPWEPLDTCPGALAEPQSGDSPFLLTLLLLSSSGPWRKQRRPPLLIWTTAPTLYKVRGPRGLQHPSLHLTVPPAAPHPSAPCPPPRAA